MTNASGKAKTRNLKSLDDLKKAYRWIKMMPAILSLFFLCSQIFSSWWRCTVVTTFWLLFQARKNFSWLFVDKMFQTEEIFNHFKSSKTYDFRCGFRLPSPPALYNQSSKNKQTNTKSKNKKFFDCYIISITLQRQVSTKRSNILKQT